MNEAPDDGDLPSGDPDDHEPTSKKSERKRQREKQRRFDLANAFDELALLLGRIEPEDLDSSSGSRKRKKRNGDEPDIDPADAAGMTRLDLIGRTILAIRRLHGENHELKQALAQQHRSRGGGTSDDREVLVMVPTLTPADSIVAANHSGPTSQYQQYYHPHQGSRGYHQHEYAATSQQQPPVGYYASSAGPPSQYGGYHYQQGPPPWNQQGSLPPSHQSHSAPPPPVPPGQMVGYHGHPHQQSPQPHHHHHHQNNHPGAPSPASARGEGD